MRLISRIRYLWTSFLHGPSSLMKLQEEMIRLHLGYSKIIGWENGLPVKGLLVPSEFSEPFINSGAVLLNSLKYGIRYPGVATLAITGKCNCACPHCAAYLYKGEDIPSELWIRAIKEMTKLGVFTIIIEGGEPLMREDLPEIIRNIDGRFAIPVIYTNGSLLSERIYELKKSGLNRILVSIDFSAPEKHDEHRHHKGLFNKALDGIESAKKAKMLVGISTFVTPERFYSGILEEIIKLGGSLKVNEVAVFDAIPSGCLSTREDLKHPNKKYLKELREFFETHWKKKRGPGLWWYGQITSIYSCGCPAGITMFHIANNGNFTPCDGIPEPVGSIKDESLEELWIKLNREAMRRREKMGIGCWLKNNEKDN